MSTANKKIEAFIARLGKDYPQFKFKPGSSDHWSPKYATIYYKLDQPLHLFKYSLLHELAHAQLEHVTYHSDFELLKLEVQAWDLAAEIGKKIRGQY